MVRIKKLNIALMCLLASASIATSTPAIAEESTQTKIDTAKKEAETAKTKVEDQKEEVNELKEKKKEEQKTLQELTDDLTEVTTAIAESDEQISEKQKTISKIEEELKPLQKNLDEAEEELEAAQEDYNTRYNAMKSRLQYLYEHGNESILDVLAKSSSLSDAVNKQDYIQKVSEYDTAALEEYQAVVDKVKKVKEDAETKRDAVKVKKDAAKTEKDVLQELKNEQLEQQNELSELIETYAGNIEITEKEIEEAEAKATELQKELDKKNANVATLQAQLKKEQAVTSAASSGTWTQASAYNGTESDRYLMANIIFCEAGNQPYEGQVAVGAVIMNRVRSSACPDTISGVVYQKNQFSPVASGRLALALARNDATESCYKAADAAMAGESPIGDCLFFRTPVSGINYKYKIGGHIFY